MPSQVLGFNLPDLGARCCEFFFLISGYLEGYRHATNYQFTFEELESNFFRKLKAVYPKHLLFLLLAIAAALLLAANGLDLTAKRCIGVH